MINLITLFLRQIKKKLLLFSIHRIVAKAIIYHSTQPHIIGATIFFTLSSFTITIIIINTKQIPLFFFRSFLSHIIFIT